MEAIFKCRDRLFLVERSSAGAVSWTGTFDGRPIEQAVITPDGRSCILLLGSLGEAMPLRDNLLCIDRACEVRWVARLPDGLDSFVHVSLGSTGVLANTWSGYRVTLATDTGSETDREFVK